MLVLISVVQQNALHNKLTRNGTNNQITTLGIYISDRYLHISATKAKVLHGGKHACIFGPPNCSAQNPIFTCVGEKYTKS